MEHLKTGMLAVVGGIIALLIIGGAVAFFTTGGSSEQGFDPTPSATVWPCETPLPEHYLPENTFIDRCGTAD